MNIEQFFIYVLIIYLLCCYLTEKGRDVVYYPSPPYALSEHVQCVQ